MTPWILVTRQINSIQCEFLSRNCIRRGKLLAPRVSEIRQRARDWNSHSGHRSSSSSSSSFEPQHRPQCYNYPIRSMPGREMRREWAAETQVGRDNYKLIGKICTAMIIHAANGNSNKRAAFTKPIVALFAPEWHDKWLEKLINHQTKSWIRAIWKNTISKIFKLYLGNMFLC